MSKELRWILRLVIYLPLAFILFMAFNAYVASRWQQSLDVCLNTTAPALDHPQQTTDFIHCLQKKSNLLVLWRMKPEQLYQAVKPHTPCYWLGKWQVKKSTQTFIIELKPDGFFHIDEQSYKNTLPQYPDSFDGVWSSPASETMFWFTEGIWWPVDRNRVEWLNQDQVVIHELDGAETRYQRQTTPWPNCPLPAR
jgi:hypothetical protein